MTCSFRPRGFLKTQWPCLQGCYLPTVSTHQWDQGDFLSTLHQCSPRNSKSFLGVPPAQVPSQHTLDGMWPPQPAGGEADSSLSSRGPPHPPLPRQETELPTGQTGSTFFSRQPHFLPPWLWSWVTSLSSGPLKNKKTCSSHSVRSPETTPTDRSNTGRKMHVSKWPHRAEPPRPTQKLSLQCDNWSLGFVDGVLLPQANVTPPYLTGSPIIRPITSNKMLSYWNKW